MTIARWADLVVAVCGLFWTCFGLACGAENGLLGALFHAAVPGFMMLAVAWLGWHQPAAGGGLAAALAIAAWLFFNRTTNGFVLGLMIVPLLAAGGVMLWAGLTRH